jgi:hypothetical protein
MHMVRIGTNDDGVGDDGRKQRQQPADERRGKDAEDSGSDHQAVDSEQADIRGRRHRQHRADRGKGDAHHDWQPDTDAGKSDALHQGGQSAGEQVRADQERDVLRRQFQRPTDDQGYGNSAGIHDQHVLQAERQKARGRQDLIDRMQFGAHDLVLRGRGTTTCGVRWIQGACQIPRGWPDRSMARTLLVMEHTGTGRALDG